MPPAKHESTHPKQSSMLSLLSGWGQQGMQTLFATQRILLDLAMRQNASVMQAVRQHLSDPDHSPTAIFSEMAETSMASFLEGQEILLELGKQQNEILLNGVKERAGDSAGRRAMIDLLQRSMETFIEMHEEYLKIASKQTHSWLESAKAGKPFRPEYAIDVAREAMDNFAKAQKRFLDLVAEETTKATSGKPLNASSRKKPADISEVAREATESLIEAQKRLVDVVGKQMHTGVQSAGKALNMVRPFPFLPVNELTREVVKSYVDAQKALMDVMVKPINGAKPAASRKVPKRAKTAVAVA